MVFAVLKAVAVGAVAHSLLMPFGRYSPMQRAIEQPILLAMLDAVGMSHFKDVGLTATRPTVFLYIVAHHPECRPQAIGRLREFYPGFYNTVCKPYLSERVDSSGSEILAFIIPAARRNHKIAVTNAYIVRAVDIILQFCVAATAAVDLDIPIVAVQRVAIEIILPNNLITGFVGTSRKCRRAKGKARQHQRECFYINWKPHSSTDSINVQQSCV